MTCDRAPDEDQVALLRRVDADLYEAKRDGRNQSATASHIPLPRQRALS